MSEIETMPPKRSSRRKKKEEIEEIEEEVEKVENVEKAEEVENVENVEEVEEVEIVEGPDENAEEVVEVVKELPPPPKPLDTSNIEVVVHDALAFDTSPPPPPLSAPVRVVTKIMDASWRKNVKDLATPAVLYDVKELLNGRVIWRKVANWSEILSRFLAASSTVLAYAASVEIENVQRDVVNDTNYTTASALSFTAGVSGSVALVLNILASWGRTQAIERNDALNNIFHRGGIQEMPSVMQFESVGNEQTNGQRNADEGGSNSP